MKFALVLVVLCFVALAVSAGKTQKKKDYYQEQYQKHSLEEHDFKKYSKEQKHHHHHQKHHLYKTKESEKERKQKHVSKTAPYEVPPQEAAYQADIKANKKHLKQQQIKPEENLHLQDLTFEEKSETAGNPIRKSPHEYQRGHHKTNQNFGNSDGQTQGKGALNDEKLFEEQSPKENSPKESPPVLEDTFEALNDNGGTKKHLKKGSKQKKANHKGKKEKKSKKDKKQKTEKFQKW